MRGCLQNYINMGPFRSKWPNLHVYPEHRILRQTPCICFNYVNYFNPTVAVELLCAQYFVHSKTVYLSSRLSIPLLSSGETSRMLPVCTDESESRTDNPVTRVELATPFVHYHTRSSSTGPVNFRFSLWTCTRRGRQCRGPYLTSARRRTGVGGDDAKRRGATEKGYRELNFQHIHIRQAYSAPGYTF